MRLIRSVAMAAAVILLSVGTAGLCWLPGGASANTHAATTPSFAVRPQQLTVLVTDGHLPYPYGREMTGYELANLADTLAKAKRGRGRDLGCSLYLRSA